MLTINLFQVGVSIATQNQPRTSEEAPKAFMDNQNLNTILQGDRKARFNLKHTVLTGLTGNSWILE